MAELKDANKAPIGPSSARRSIRGTIPPRIAAAGSISIEEPHLGRLMAKICRPCRSPSSNGFVFAVRLLPRRLPTPLQPLPPTTDQENQAMTGTWNDFNDAKQNSNIIPKGTLAKVRLTIRPGGFDDPAQGWTGGYATRGTTGSVYLNARVHGAGRAIRPAQDLQLIGLYSPKGPDWANMGRSLVRGMLELGARHLRQGQFRPGAGRAPHQRLRRSRRARVRRRRSMSAPTPTARRRTRSARR